MKSLSKYIHIPYVPLCAGVIGAVLRLMLYHGGFDEKGLLPRFAPLHIGCIALVLGVGVYLFLSLQKLDGSKEYSLNFPPSRLAGMGEMAAAAVMALGALTQKGTDLLALIRFLLGLGAAAALVAAGICRIRGVKTPVALHSLLSIYFAIDMICRYRLWSGNPQLQDYCFHVLASAFLSIAAYQRTAFSAGLGKRRMHLYCCLMGLMLCLMAIPGPENSLMYLGGGIWALSALCSLPSTARYVRNRQED